MTNPKKIAKSSFTKAVNLICPKSSKSLSSGYWRPMLTNNPTLDREARNEVFDSAHAVDAFATSIILKSRKRTKKGIREQNNVRISLAFLVHTHALGLLQKALDTIYALPKRKDTAADRERATQQIEFFQNLLDDLKTALEIVIQYARENKIERDDVDAIVDNFEYKIDAIAYDVLELRNRTIRYSRSAEKAETSDKIIKRLESNRQKFREQHSTEIPPPDYEGSWTPKLIAEWFDLPENVVRDRARQLTLRKPSSHVETFRPGKPGQHLKWNRPQAERLVRHIRATTQLGKKGRLR
jgi:hypothetical protein